MRGVAAGPLLAAGLALAACSSATPRPLDGRVDGDAFAFGEGLLPPRDTGPTAHHDVAPQPPVPRGAAALTGLRALYRLRLDTLAAQRSSYDRSGGNSDGFGASNFLYTDAAGERVLVDERGPGCAYNLWLTGADPQQAWIKAYVDDEATPRLHVTLAELFAGTRPPFRWPLVFDPAASSGGYTSYVPLPFARALRITSNGAGEHFFYHVGLHRYAADRTVSSWTGAEPLTAARTLLGNLGAPPYAAAATASTSAAVVDVPARGQVTIAELDGPAVVTGLRLRVPGITRGEVTDAGHALTGDASFTVRVDPANQGVRLLRRRDGCVGDQTARVLVDGVLVGTWSDGPAVAADCWRDSAFEIPAAHAAGKAQLAIRLEGAGGDPDFNAFTYWVLSRTAAGHALTDVLDVGHPADEQAHDLQLGGQTWSGWRSFSYPHDGAAAQELLAGLRLRCTWDDQDEPAVDATLGDLFALGRFGARGAAAALLVGIDHGDALYLYFPMPFATHARLTLVSERAVATPGIAATVTHAPLAAGFGDAAYFRTATRHEVHEANNGTDLVALDVTGAGHLVGLVQSVRGPLHRGYLEGDERIHVDGSASPAYHGTGTEDLYQGGWYFLFGPFSRATHGNAAHAVEGSGDGTAMYRLFVPDVIPFRTALRVSLEHGNRNDAAVEAWTLAYYYHRPEPACRISDALDVGDAASEAAHGYAIAGETWSGSQRFTFEGERDEEPVTDDGRAHTGSARFTLRVEPENDGVLLRRRFDQGIAGARAEVRVDGALAGVWHHPGRNATHRWREADLLLPAALTRGKSQIEVEERFVPGSPDFNAFRYQAWSCSWPR